MSKFLALRLSGRDYVDLLGLDNYADVGRSGIRNHPRKTLRFHHRVESIDPTCRGKEQSLRDDRDRDGRSKGAGLVYKDNLDPIKQNPEIRLLTSWCGAMQTPKHHYAPYPGHASAPDFVKFFQDPGTLFEADLKNVYKN